MRLQTFGAVRLTLESGDDASSLTQRRRLALLAMVAAAGRQGASRDKVMACLWPESDQERARHALAQAVYTLRRGAGDQSLIQGERELRINPAILTSDVAELLDAAAAGNHPRVIELYAGPFLDGFQLTASPEFDRWAAAERDRFRGLAASSLEAAARDATAVGNTARAREHWKARVALDPLNGAANAEYMRALAANGEQLAAIQQGRSHQSMVHQQLGAQPDHAVRDLLAELQQSTPSMLPQPDTTVGVGAAQVRTSASRPWRLIVVTGLAALLAVAAFRLVRRQPGAEAGPVSSVAVLPFASLSADSSDALVSAGIAEDLITRLGRIGGLRVAARTSSFSLRNRNLSAGEIGELLRVSSVLEGSMRRSGDSVRVTTRLIDARTGYELWSRTFDRRWNSLFALQDDVARGIADALKHEVLDRLPARPPALATQSLQAYIYYLQGRHAWTERSAHGLRRAFAYFDSALAIDSTYAAADAAIAATWLVAPTYGLEAPPRPYLEAQRASARALARDSNNAEALGVSALARQLVNRDLDGAEQQFVRAIALEPQDATLRHWHALNLLVNENPERAIAEVREAHALDPLAPAVGTGVAVIEYFAGHPDKAVAASRDVLRAEPGFHAARNWLGLALLAQGDTAAAIDQLDQAVRASGGDARYRASLAFALAASGRRDSARVLLDGLDADRQRIYVPSVNLALAHAAAGDAEIAMGLLQRGFTERDPGILTLSIDPKARELRADPRFAPMLSRY